MKIQRSGGHTHITAPYISDGPAGVVVVWGNAVEGYYLAFCIDLNLATDGTCDVSRKLAIFAIQATATRTSLFFVQGQERFDAARFTCGPITA